MLYEYQNNSSPWAKARLYGRFSIPSLLSRPWRAKADKAGVLHEKTIWTLVHFPQRIALLQDYKTLNDA